MHGGGRYYGLVDAWMVMNAWNEEVMDAWMEGWVNGRREVWMDRWMERLMDG